MITDRQEKLLNFLVKEYIATSEPVSSFDLKKAAELDVSPATVRNDLQDLTKAGYIKQPHTSAGRIPTKKAYKHFADKFSMDEFIVRQIKFAHQQMEQEMRFAEDLMKKLEQDNLFEILNILDSWHKKIKN
jgi:heat-inducible transcriptional repressor